VAYVNDSKATNVEAALKALEAYPQGTHLILGGKDKASDYRPLARACRGHCRAVYLIGAASPLIEQAFAEVGREEGPVPPPLHRCGDLEQALHEARRNARQGEVVLLSPACASFDQYRDYEERGEHFLSLVRAMEHA
jgi:UDP-N-acetylmuramoylalanine--D-glutamate ligase